MTANDFGRQHKRLPYFLNNFFFVMYSLSYRLKRLSPFCTAIDLYWIRRLQNSRFFSQNRFSVA